MKRLLILGLTIFLASLAFPLEVASNISLLPDNALALPSDTLSSDESLSSTQGAVLYTDTIKVVKGGILSLSHRGIVQGSEKVIANGRFLKRDVDYLIDYTNGTLLLPGEVKATTLIISYLYDPNKQDQPAGGFPLQLALTGSNSTSLNLLTYFRPGTLGQNDAETWIAGSHFTSQLGSNASFKSLLFISRAASPSSYVAGLAKNGIALAPEQKGKAIANWLDLGLGKGKLSLFFQKIDKDFSAPQEIPDNINGDDVSFLKQEAGTEKIGIGYQGSNFNLSFVQQSVDPLTRDDQGAAKEKGITKQILSGQFKELLPNLSLNFSQTQIEDKKGKIEQLSWNLQGKNFSLAVKKQEVGRDFARFSNLTEGNAGQLAKEQGLTRQSIEGALSFSPKLQTFFSLNSIEDGKEGLRSSNLQLQGDIWQFSFFKSQSSEGFRRFADLSDPEKQRFANEWGISKSLLSGSLKLDSLLPGLTLSLTSRQLSDSAGGLDGKSIEIKMKDQPIFRFSTQKIDPSFTRFGDIAEPDKDRLAQERAAEKKDIFLALPFSKSLAFSTSITKIDSLDITRSDGMWGKSTLHTVNNLAWTGKDNIRTFFTWDSTKQDGDVRRTNDIYNLIVEKAFNNANLRVQRMQGVRTEGDKEFRSALTTINLGHSLKNNISYNLNFKRNELEDGNTIEEGNLNIAAPLLKGNAGTLSFSFKESAEQAFKSIVFIQPLASQSQFKGEVAKIRQGDQEGKKQEFSLTRTLLPGLTSDLAYGIQSLGNSSSSYRLFQTTYQPQGAPYKISYMLKDRSGGNNTDTQAIDITYPLKGKNLTLSMLKNPEGENSKPLHSKRVAIQFQGSPILSGQYILDTNYINGQLNKWYSLQFTPSEKFNLKLSLADNVPDPNQKLTRKLNWEIAFPLNDKLSFKGTNTYDFIEREKKGVYKTLFAISGKLSAYEMLDASLSLDYSSLAGDKLGGITYSFSYSRNISADNSFGLSGYYTDNFAGRDNVGMRLDLAHAF